MCGLVGLSEDVESDGLVCDFMDLRAGWQEERAEDHGTWVGNQKRQGIGSGLVSAGWGLSGE